MTVYGSECGEGGFFLFKDGVLYGEYPSPVDITEAYIGEPYVTYTDMGQLGGRQGWLPTVYDGAGNIIIGNFSILDRQNISLEAPLSEGGTWKVRWTACQSWRGTSWGNTAAGFDQATIHRYSYAITST